MLSEKKKGQKIVWVAQASYMGLIRVLNSDTVPLTAQIYLPLTMSAVTRFQISSKTPYIFLKVPCGVSEAVQQTSMQHLTLFLLNPISRWSLHQTQQTLTAHPAPSVEYPGPYCFRRCTHSPLRGVPNQETPCAGRKELGVGSLKANLSYMPLPYEVCSKNKILSIFTHRQHFFLPRIQL